MRLKGKQLDGFNAALREGNQEKAMAELQGACARAEGIVPFASASSSLALPELQGELKEILGMMIYSTAPIGRRLEQLGLYKVPRKVEAEHAAALHWMLKLYFAHGDQWRTVGEKILKNEAPENDKLSEPPTKTP